MSVVRAVWTRRHDEHGAIAVLFAIVITVILMITAIVVDLGQARMQVRDTQQVADFSALAGARHLPLNPRAACASVLNYADANLPDFPSTASLPCGSMPATCIASTTAPATYTSINSAPYLIQIRYPVPDAEIAPAQLNDGTNACERIRVYISQDRSTLFAGIVGLSSQNLTSDAVARTVNRVSDPRLVALLLLEPYECEALVASGQAQIIVTYSADERSPGRIGLDTDGSHTRCAGRNNIYTIDAYGEINSLIQADDAPNGSRGTVTLFAMRRGQTRCDNGFANACEQDDVNDRRLIPQPIRQTARITRVPIDNRYNCKAAYPDYHGVPLSGCPLAGSSDPYIDELVAAIGTTGVPPGFLDYRTTPLPKYPKGGPCATRSSDPAIVLPPGNWYINCTGQQGLSIQNNFIVQGGNVVFEHHLSIGQSAQFIHNCSSVDWVTQTCTSPNPITSLPETCLLALCVTESSSKASYIFFRGTGRVDKDATGSIFLNNTMVYLTAGKTEIDGGAGNLVWRGPYEGPFDDLALWSNGTEEHKFGGQAILVADGIYFTPEAYPFNFSGQGAQYVVEAQFISRKLLVSGQGQLKLRPTYERSVPIYFQGVALIR